MKRTSLLLIVLLLSAVLLPLAKAGENPGPWWVKTYGGSRSDEAYAVAIAPNGDVIVAGWTESFGAGYRDVWVLRLDANGNVKWQKTYGGNGDDWAEAVAIAENGDVIVAGVTYSFGAGSADFWVLRLDANGNVKWQKTYGGKLYDEAYAVAIAPNGDIIVAGDTCSFGRGRRDVWVLRLDENGNIKWQKAYGESNGEGARAVAVTQGLDWDIIVVGYIFRDDEFMSSVWVLRLDENGNIKWQKAYGFDSLNTGTDLILLKNGDIVVIGNHFITKLDSNGNLKWAKNVGGGTVTITKNDDIIIATGAAIMKLTPNGDLIWAKELPISFPYSAGSHFYQGIHVEFSISDGIIYNGSILFVGQNSLDILILSLPSNATLPGCNFVYNSDISFVKDISWDISSHTYQTRAKISISNAIIHDTKAQVHDTKAQVKTECSFANFVNSKIQNSSSTIVFYRSKGIVLVSAEELINKARKAFDSGDYVKALDYAKEAYQKAEEIKKQYKDAKPKFEAAVNLHEYFQENNVVVPDEVRGLFTKAQKAFESGDYPSAFDFSVQFIEKAKPLKDEYEKAKPAVEKAQATINEYKSRGIILTSAEELLNKAQQAFQQGDYADAYAYASQALKKAKEIKDQHDRALSEVKDAREVASRAGLDISPLLNVFNAGDYEKAYQMALDAQKAAKAIIQAESFLSPLGGAKKAFERGDYVTAYQLAVEAKEKRDLYQKLFIAGIIITGVLTGVAARQWKKIAEKRRKAEEVEKLIAEAKNAPPDKRLAVLEKALKTAEGEEELKGKVLAEVKLAKENIRATYQNLINEFRKALDELNVEAARAKLNEAKPYAKALGSEDELRRLDEKLKNTREAIKLAKRAKTAKLPEAAELAREALQKADIPKIRAQVEGILKRAEDSLNRSISKGDALLSSGDYEGAIRAYESARRLAKALGEEWRINSRIQTAKERLEKKRKTERLKKILEDINSALSRRDYQILKKLFGEAESLAEELDMGDKVRNIRDELRIRLENLQLKARDAQLSGEHQKALALYSEALSIAGVIGENKGEIQEAIREIEKQQREKILRNSIKISVPQELPQNGEGEVSVIVTNRFSDELSVTVDLSSNAKYFEMNRDKIEFPPIEPGETIGQEIKVRPKFIGDFKFKVLVESNFGSLERTYTIKAIKPTATPSTGSTAMLTPLTRTPIINPVEALQELYSDFQYIGEGGFARVYKAKRKDGKTVALKIPKTLDLAVGRAFVREITNWLHLKHPNIVELYDVNVLPVPYLEMEYCESSLARVQKPLPVDEASLIVFNIAEALKYAHSKKIVHRDLKPSNVLLKNGLPKISDWGLSKVLEESMSATTTASFTPFYAAPEQIDKKYGHTDERTDIWQLGVIFYELVTGRLPFEGSLSQVMMGILRDEPVPPSQLNPAAREVEPIIMRMLAKRKEERYRSIEELQRDLARVLNMTYSESLKESKTLGDVRRATYYLTELLLINLKTNNPAEAYKYASDLVFYAKGELKEEVQKLAEQVKFRLEEGLNIPQELIEKAEIIVHKIRTGFKRI